MEWKKFTIKTRSEAEEIITGILADMGIYSVEIEDKVPLTDRERAQMFVDLEPVRVDDGLACVSFYLEDGEDEQAVLKEFADRIEAYRAMSDESCYIDPGECSITADRTEDVDWINNWKQHFKHFYIDDILFIPSWESEGKSDEQIKSEALSRGEKLPSFVIHIDPGMAFGTGKHETTMLCIRALEEVLNVGDKVLDIGTGSGILSLMAFKFGAGEVFATDLDTAAISACEDNLKRNRLESAAFRLVIGNIIDDEAVQQQAGTECYDVVVSNILADILVPMMPAACRALKHGGVIITSGIIEGREGDVIRAMEEAGLGNIETRSMGEWRMVRARKAYA
jgi:ribosomal protein L11 methyltransferase